MRALVYLCVLLSLPLAVTAATVAITWVNPTQDTNGAPLASGALKSATLYRGTRADGSDLTPYQRLAVVTAFVDTVGAGETWCYAPTVTADVESDLGPIACKTSLSGLRTSATTLYMRSNSTDFNILSPVGTIALDVLCDASQFIGKS